MGVVFVVSLAAVIVGGALLFAADVWAEGFDIGRREGARWWWLYIFGGLLLATGLLGILLATAT